MKTGIRTIAIYIAMFALAMSAEAAQVLEGGSAGETVTVLTRRLCELGYMDQQVGEYDDSVTSAIGDFQTANGLERTGIADIDTQLLMNSEDAVPRSEFMTSYASRYAGVNITSGSSGENVRALQTVLNELDFYAYNPDGVFGEGTYRALAEYQRANGLEPTGIADAPTQRRLFDGESVRRDDYVLSQCASKGDSGARVHSLQERLSELGYYRGEHTGTYGEHTTRAVKRFQNDNGLEVTGNVDVATYEALFDPNAAYASDDGAIYPGDAGDEVYLLQQRLNAAGFFDHEPDGVYGYTTETAVMLFKAANGLEVSGTVTSEMREILNSDAYELLDVVPVAGALTAEQVNSVCTSAAAIMGADFTDKDSLLIGLNFAEYVYAGLGMQLGDISAIAAKLGDPETELADMQLGDIVVLGQADDETLVICFAICTGEDMLTYVDYTTGLVVTESIDQVHYVSAYVWKMSE